MKLEKYIEIIKETAENLNTATDLEYCVRTYGRIEGIVFSSTYDPDIDVKEYVQILAEQCKFERNYHKRMGELA